MSRENNYEGRCFCGEVTFSLTGEPDVMAYCHCDSCRHWSAGPVNAFTLWQPDNLKITKGSTNISDFDKNPTSLDQTIVSNRVWCKTCGGHLYTEHPGMGLVDVPAATIDNFDFKPGFHVHYQESVHHMLDGLPKFKDLPAEAGGSGEQLIDSI